MSATQQCGGLIVAYAPCGHVAAAAWCRSFANGQALRERLREWRDRGYETGHVATLAGIEWVTDKCAIEEPTP